jgi:tetraacyldisaccharide 4'-kinase
VTPPLSPFEWLYFQALRRRRERLGTPRGEGVAVVSVGNLSLGGTGKTPAVRWLARRALAAGIAPAIVSRGYGGSLSAQGAVVSDGRQVLLGAAQAGDEPIEHARSLPGVPVVIGRDRHAAVRRARDLGAQVAILDDGFSFWSLARACDIVLLDARRPLGNGRLLPRGRLREEPAALGRAHAILLTRADSCTPEELERSHEIVRRYSAAPVWRCRHAPVAVVDQSGREQSLQVLAGAPVAAVSALANNALFARSLEKLGAQVRAHSARRDHHAWSEREIARAAEQARRLGALALVTTGKDAAKIPEPWTRGLPLWQLRIEMEIDGGEALWDLVRAALDSAPR